MKTLIADCKELLDAYHAGLLGQTRMPEESHPPHLSAEERFAYFTLPMALNYQRNSYTLWESAQHTFEDATTKDVFDIAKVSTISDSRLREMLGTYKLALQPNKHTHTWKTIATTVHAHFGNFEGLFDKAQHDFLQLKRLVQIEYKAGFPYLSGPKIFNYWSWIIQEYGKATLKNSEYIDIAPDTHVTQCSVKLEVITPAEAERMTKEELSEKWRTLLHDSDILPIEMHAPLWFWSRNGFVYTLKRNQKNK